MRSAEDPRLSKLSGLCLGFPYFLDDHHGDGIVSVCCKMGLGENEEVVGAEPKKLYLPAYIAHRGWVALRLDLGPVDWEEVAQLVAGSYSLVAPKKLAKLVRD